MQPVQAVSLSRAATVARIALWPRVVKNRVRGSRSLHTPLHRAAKMRSFAAVALLAVSSEDFVELDVFLPYCLKVMHGFSLCTALHCARFLLCLVF